MQMAVPSALSTMTWLGRGPHENYWDRHTGAAVGRYTGRVVDLVHDYVRPQENANRTDVRWLALTDASGAGLLASGLPLLSASAWPYTMQELESATHTNELPHRGRPAAAARSTSTTDRWAWAATTAGARARTWSTRWSQAVRVPFPPARVHSLAGRDRRRGAPAAAAALATSAQDKEGRGPVDSILGDHEGAHRVRHGRTRARRERLAGRGRDARALWEEDRRASTGSCATSRRRRPPGRSSASARSHASAR